MAKGETPVFRVSEGTAFKAGFFGAIGFLVAQVIIGVSVLVIALGLGLVSAGFLAGIAAAASKPRVDAKIEEVQPTKTLTRESRPQPAPASGQIQADR